MPIFRRTPLAATALLTVTTAWATATAAYLGLLTAAAALPPRRRQLGPARHTWLVFVPAHNEESVIADTMRSLRELEYPADMFDVHVVADNCTDRTVEIVESFGFHAHDRVAPDDPGKGPALNWLFDRLRDTDFDAVAVIDADTIVHRNFLAAIDDAVSRGAVVAQGFYSVRRPEASRAAGVRFAALACRHHLRPLGRQRLGGSCGLYGNGMGFRREVLERRRWTGHLVEDAEFQMELLIADNQRVTYVPAAVVEAEMPSTLEQSRTQNARWERGRLQLAKRYLPVLGRIARSGPPPRKIAAIDAAADHLTPPLSVVAALPIASLSLEVMAGIACGRLSHRRLKLNVLTLVIFGLHVGVALKAVAAPRAVYRSLATVPTSLFWKVGVWVGVLAPKREVTWERTTRNAST